MVRTEYMTAVELEIGGRKEFSTFPIGTCVMPRPWQLASCQAMNVLDAGGV